MTVLLNNPTYQAALIALIVAITGYIQMRTRTASQATAIDSLQKGQQAAGGSGPTIVTVPTHAAAGPAAPGLFYPPWNQTTDIAVGGISATGQIDCGWECLAMCIRILTGVPVPASYLRWLVKGPGDTSLATADDLVAGFAACEHLAHRRDAPYEALVVELRHSMAKGYPAIVLGRWLSPVGHWMCCERIDDRKGVLWRDPYGGTEYWMNWTRVQAQYEGSYVHVDERATYAA